MIDIIRKSKFVIVPSICNENCPYSILESLAIGKAVVGSNMGGIPELIENNKNGYIYKYNDINDLSSKMKMLFDDKKLVEKLSKKSKELALAKYSQAKYYNNIMNIYDMVKRG